MLRWSMTRPALFVVFATLTLLAQKRPGTRHLPSFPMPSNMVETASDLRAVANDPALVKAIGATPSSPAGASFGAARVSLGALGSGAIVADRGAGSCASKASMGLSGNCSILVYFQQQGTYGSAYLYSGWAYEVVKSGKPVPDIVIMTNMSSWSGLLTRFSFVHGTYVKTGCDDVELRSQDGKGNILDPAQDDIQPCP